MYSSRAYYRHTKLSVRVISRPITREYIGSIKKHHRHIYIPGMIFTRYIYCCYTYWQANATREIVAQQGRCTNVCTIPSFIFQKAINLRVRKQRAVSRESHPRRDKKKYNHVSYTSHEHERIARSPITDTAAAAAAAAVRAAYSPRT